MRVTVTPEAVAMVQAGGGTLYVWRTSSAGCAPATFLHVDRQPPDDRTFTLAALDDFALHVADGGAWPAELTIEAHRGRLRALWDGALQRL